MSKMAAAGSILEVKHYKNDAAKALIAEFTKFITDMLAVLNRMQNCLVGLNGATFADATQVGKIKTVGGTVEFRVNGEHYIKAATDNLWDFTAETDTAALKYRAYWLYLDNAGAATFGTISSPGTGDSTSAVLAKAALLAAGEPAADKAVVGVFVAGPSTDMSADAIVAKSGATMEYGIPEDMRYTPTASLLYS